MDFRILGPFEVWDGDDRRPLGPYKQQALLVRLLLDVGRVVPMDRLVDDIWGEAVPESAVKMVQIYVSGLRKILPAGMLSTSRPGYVLELGDDELDLHRFGRLRREGADALASGDPATASLRLYAALALWRGPALGGLTEPFAGPERAALEEAHLACREDRIEADLRLGRHGELVGELEALLARHPVRERLRGQAMLALYRSGRHGEALGSYQAFRRNLDDELGIEPSADLRELQVRILRQDPSLDHVVEHDAPSDRDERPPRRGAAQPVGRDAEIDTLADCLGDAVAGQRRVIFLTGEPGIGKSTLVETLLGRAEQAGVAVGLGQCVEHHGPSEAYLPVFDAIGRLARGTAGDDVAQMLGEYAPTWLMQMPWIASRSDRATLAARATGVTPERMLREMVDLVEGLAATRPVVLVLEDLHWSDYSTIDLVTTLARRREPTHLLLLVTYRPQEAAAAGHPLHRVARELRLRGHAIELTPAPLSAEAVGHYLRSRGARASDAVVAGLRARTHGNPLFLEKVVDSWREHGLEGEDAAAEALLEGVPETLRELVEGQLLALDEVERDALEAASVAGAEVAGAAVAAGCERAPEHVEAVLERLAARGAFVEAIDEETWPDGTVTGRYRFIHDLCQEIAYESLPRPRRRAMHVRIGLRVERGHPGRTVEVAAQLASQFVGGRDAVRAVRYLQLAAEQAFHRVAPRDALEHVTSGLALLDALPPELRARAELGLRTIEGPARVAIRGWDDDGAEQAFLRARSLCEDLGEVEALQWALFKLATFFEVRAQYTRSEELLAESFALPVEAEPVGLLVDSHELMACSLLHQGAFTRSLEHAERVLSLYDGHYANPLTAAYGDNPAVAAHSWASLALWFMGYADRARERALASIATAKDPRRASALASAYAQAAAVGQLRREPDATLAWAEEAIRAAAGGGYRYRWAMARVLRGWALVELERCDEGMEEAVGGVLQARETGVRMDEGYLLGVLADACLRAGRWREGLRAVDEALALGGSERAYFYEPELVRLQGELLQRTGAAAIAVERFDRAIAAARDGRSPALELRAAVSRATALLADGRGGDAIESLSAARAGVAEGTGTPDLRAADELLTRLAAATR